MSRAVSKIISSSPLFKVIQRTCHNPLLVKQIVRHFLVSGVSGLINIFGFNALLGMDVGFVLANIIIYAVNITLTFLLQKFFTYMAKGNTPFQLIKFLVNAGAYFLFDTLFIYIFLEVFHLIPLLAKICTLSILVTFNFLAQKFWVFKKL